MCLIFVFCLQYEAFGLLELSRKACVLILNLVGLLTNLDEGIGRNPTLKHSTLSVQSPTNMVLQWLK